MCHGPTVESAPSRIRTCNLPGRSRLLYPIELRARAGNSAPTRAPRQVMLGFRAMRTSIAILLSIYLAGCSKGSNEGAEAAKKEAEKEQKEKEKSGGVAQKINPPVAGRAKLDCAA